MRKQSAMLDREHVILATSKRGGRKYYYFLICDICFWCASLCGPDLSKYHEAFLCPVCEGGKVQAMPLASDEIYVLR
jgi:hypothetical protein